MVEIPSAEHLMRVLLACATVLLAAACATPKPNVTVADHVTIVGNDARFSACGLSARFSGPPKRLLAKEMSPVTSMLGGSANWAVDGLNHQQYRLEETAVCLCRDLEISEREMTSAEQAMRGSKQGRFLRTYETPYARKAIEYEATVSTGIDSRVRAYFPSLAPRCMFMAAVTVESSKLADSLAFFGRLGPVTTVPASERLRELGDLHRRKLITDREYEQKTMEILRERDL